ncbi:MAG: ATP-binding protein [Pseudomonadota bacterium]
MVSSSVRPSPFIVAVLLRALLLGVLTFVVMQLLVTTHLYATTLVVFGVAALIVADLVRVVSRADRTVERFLAALSADSVETAPRNAAGLGRLSVPFERAAASLQAVRATQSRRSEYLQSLLDTVPAGLLVLHTDNRVTLANRAAHRLALEPAQTLQSIEALGADAARAIAGLVPGTHQILRLASGVQVLASAGQFQTPGGMPERLIALQRLSGELDAVELKAWDDMVRVLAHEMMNSLTPIASLSESLDALLREGGHTEEVASALEAIKRRSLGLMSFVDRYRKLAELPHPALQNVSLHNLLDGIGRLMTANFSGRQVSFASRVEPADLAARLDPELLEQALINLLRNAVDAVAGVADARIEIRCWRENARLYIAVVDNGRGLTRDERDQIFVPFFTTKAGGSGIGLNLARRIALAHGGLLSVADNTPQGSVFTLAIPAG